jgi:hypothetical protein
VRCFILFFCAASYLAGAGEALAESSTDSPDCNAIRTTLIPYQVKLIKEHSVWRELHTIQMTRDRSGYDSLSGRVSSTTSYVRKATTLNGTLTVDDIQYVRGQSATRIVHATRDYDGIDLSQMDFQSDQKFAVTMKWGETGGPVQEKTADASYKYLKTENVMIDPCTFTAQLSETIFTDRKSGKEDKLLSWHFPDLRLTVANPSPDLTFQSISTTFDPIEFAEPNWPPAPSKVDNH